MPAAALSGRKQRSVPVGFEGARPQNRFRAGEPGVSAAPLTFALVPYARLLWHFRLLRCFELLQASHHFLMEAFRLRQGNENSCLPGRLRLPGAMRHETDCCSLIR
jgi:hypothetical protein